MKNRNSWHDDLGSLCTYWTTTLFEMMGIVVQHVERTPDLGETELISLASTLKFYK